MDDQVIIDWYWERSEYAIVATKKKYGSYCHRVSNNILQNREDTEECLNDLYMKAWESIPPTRPFRLLGEVDDRYIEESMMIERKPYQRLKWGGLLIAVAAGIMLFTSNVWNERIPLSTDSNANSVHIVDQSKATSDISEENMMDMTEDELFSKWNPVVVRGTVTDIRHIEIDFNGETKYQSLITIHVSNVYRGDV
ncbi:hypothetical protein ABXV15_02885 [Exiguobacterium profundum]|uniref:hypothetical protein n=1 Tax=Exiguobacterium profundum TaxID=307643 RepID=UPI0033992546